MLQLILGFVFAAVIAYAALRARSLSRSGAWGALLVGTVIFGLGGWQWAVLLLAFFVSSSALTRTFARRKAALNEKFDKGGVHDLGQVLANGGIASVFAGLHFFFPHAAWTWATFVPLAGRRQHGYLGHRTGRAEPQNAALDHKRQTS